MILIADSGSTKTSWCLTGKNVTPQYFKTTGINPFFRDTQDIAEELKHDLVPKTGMDIEQIHFYGAGIINREKGKVVGNALQKLFSKAQIEVESDLLAAARSTLGNKKGIACILGTGSNSCLYNGKEIAEHIPPLGFILGDEGSGAVLGRKLLADFLKGIMPVHISKKFQDLFNPDYAGFMEGVYKKEKPNQFLAQLVPFIKENIADSYCSKLIEDSFEEFLIRNVSRYPGFRQLPVCFVGSVAYYFQDQLKTVFLKNQLQVSTILMEPLNGLLEFHLNNL